MVPQRNKVASSSRSSKEKAKAVPTLEHCTPSKLDMSKDFTVDATSSTPGRCEHVSQYISIVTNIETVKTDYRWGKAVQVEIPSPDENITDYKDDFLYVYTYPLTLCPTESSESSEPSSPEIDPVILKFLRQISSDARSDLSLYLEDSINAPSFHRRVGGEVFTLNHLIRLYNPQFYRCLIRLHN